jgi:hypothetical protein
MPILRKLGKGMPADEPLVMIDCLIWARMQSSLHSWIPSEAETTHLPDEDWSYTESTDYVAEAIHETVLQIPKFNLHQE